MYSPYPKKHQLTVQQQNNLLDVNHLTSERGVTGWIWEMNSLQEQIDKEKNPAQVHRPYPYNSLEKRQLDFGSSV